MYNRYVLKNSFYFKKLPRAFGLLSKIVFNPNSGLSKLLKNIQLTSAGVKTLSTLSSNIS